MVQPGWLEPLLWGQGQTLRSLTVNSGYNWSPVGFVGMLRHLPMLRHLSLDSPPQVAGAPILRLPCHLTSLDLCGEVQSSLLDLILGGSQESLEVLHINDLSDGDVFDFSNFNSLYTIKFAWPVYDLGRADLLHLFQTLGAVPSLKTLAFISVPDDVRVEVPLLENIEFLRRLPPSLRRLEDSSGLVLSAPYLLAFLADRTCLPLLNVVEVSIRVQQDDVHVERSVEDMQAIAAAARARGVEVLWIELVS